MADYFTDALDPATNSDGASAPIRAQYAAIAVGFTKVAPYTGNGGKLIAIDAAGTKQEAIVTTGTGSGVRATSPTLVTPTLGVATVTSVNKVAITAPATSATLTIADGKTLTASNTLTLTATDGSTLAVGAGGTISAAGFALIDDASAAAQRTTLGSTTVGDAVFIAASASAGRVALLIGTKSTVASAASPDIWTGTGSYIDYTGVGNATGFAAAPQAGDFRILVCTGAAVFTHNGSTMVVAGGTFTASAGDWVLVMATSATNFRVIRLKSDGTAAALSNLSEITASLGADVALNNTLNYFDGPSIAQGSTGTWFVSGSVTLGDSAGGASFVVKLWDGTTVIASTLVDTTAANKQICVSLSGKLASPAGNLRISVKDGTSTSGVILFNSSAESKDSTISAFRVA